MLFCGRKINQRVANRIGLPPTLQPQQVSISPRSIVSAQPARYHSDVQTDGAQRRL